MRKLLIGIGICLSLLTACKSEVNLSKEVFLTCFKIEESSVKTEYQLGENFEYDNLVIKTVYSDGKEERLENGFIVNYRDFNKAVPGEYEIYVQYKHFTPKRFKVTVLNA